MTSVIQLQSPAHSGYQCLLLDLLLSFTHLLQESDIKLTTLFCSVVETRTRVIQVSRDKRELLISKKILALSVSGLQNTYCSFMNDEEKSRSLKLTADLFVFLADSLYKGPRSRRVAASSEDGQLFCHLSSFFVLSLGYKGLMSTILVTDRVVSSFIRFIIMTAGVLTINCCVPYTLGNDAGEQWEAALSYCLCCLSEIVVEISRNDDMKFSLGTLAAKVEPSTNSFQLCLNNITKTKLGVSSLSAKQILNKM